jgi:cytochrome b
MQQGNQSKTTILVWDIPVRVMHWGLVVAVFGAWITRELEGDWFAWHTRFGYAVLVLVLTRLVWGLIGTRHARFSDFVRGPAAIATYVKRLRGDRESATSDPIGHNPLGALMILALLALLGAQAVTGLFANDQIFETGPLFGYVSVALSDQLTTWHKQIFDILVAAIALHVIAAIVYVTVLRKNIITPMITGRKTGVFSPQQGIESSQVLWALVIAVGWSLLLAWLVATAPEAFLFDF